MYVLLNFSFFGTERLRENSVKCFFFFLSFNVASTHLVEKVTYVRKEEFLEFSARLTKTGGIQSKTQMTRKRFYTPGDQVTLIAESNKYSVSNRLLTMRT